MVANLICVCVIKGMDIYSNILYVKEMSAELSYLAHRAMSTEKYCPETCCIVGNYYSLKTLHNKVISHQTVPHQEFLCQICSADKVQLIVGISIWNVTPAFVHFMKAILYFQRALKLDSKFLSAWTLMGHEYVEVRNYAAAIGEKISNCSVKMLFWGFDQIPLFELLQMRTDMRWT